MYVHYEIIIIIKLIKAIIYLYNCYVVRILIRKPKIFFIRFQVHKIVFHISSPEPNHSVSECQAQNPFTLFLNTGTLALLYTHDLSNSTSGKNHNVYFITYTILDFPYKYKHGVLTFYCLTYFV